MTNILVAGGAGYIGAHTCLDLYNKGFKPIVYDNLSNGHDEFVKWAPCLSSIGSGQPVEVGRIFDYGFEHGTRSFPPKQ